MVLPFYSRNIPLCSEKEKIWIWFILLIYLQKMIRPLLIVVISSICLAFSLTCFPLGIAILTFLWECLSALSVVSFAADFLLKDDYELINLQKQEVNMETEIKSQSSGVNMG